MQSLGHQSIRRSTYIVIQVFQVRECSDNDMQVYIDVFQFMEQKLIILD